MFGISPGLSADKEGPGLIAGIARGVQRGSTRSVDITKHGNLHSKCTKNSFTTYSGQY